MTGFTLQSPDYAILSAAAILGVAGLFGGVSGALAFLAGTAAGVFAAHFGWTLSGNYLTSMPVRFLVTGVATLLAFGTVRAIMRACVHKLLAQPADALLGFLISALTGGMLAMLLVLGLQYAGILKTKSILLDLALGVLHALG